jgi:UPF0716 protein FxsA
VLIIEAGSLHQESGFDTGWACKVGNRPDNGDMRWILILLPWLELWTLIELGSEIGGLATLLYVAATLMLGLTLLRRQGLSMLRQMQSEYGGRGLGPQLLLNDAALLGSGLLLMVPGLITDVLALLLMIGPLRRGLGRLLRGSASAPESGSEQPQRDQQAEHPQTLEGEFRRLDD